MYSRQAVVDLVESWIGKMKRMDHINQLLIFTIVSQVHSHAGQNGVWMGVVRLHLVGTCRCVKYTAIMPIEISCYYLIERAKQMGVWEENDAHVPKLGEAVLYDWQDKGVGDNTGTPDHVGTVTYVNQAAGYFVVTEGNYSDSVKKRTVSLNGRYIRGFITPNMTVIRRKASQ